MNRQRVEDAWFGVRSRAWAGHIVLWSDCFRLPHERIERACCEQLFAIVLVAIARVQRFYRSERPGGGGGTGGGSSCHLALGDGDDDGGVRTNVVCRSVVGSVLLSLRAALCSGRLDLRAVHALDRSHRVSGISFSSQDMDITAFDDLAAIGNDNQIAAKDNPDSWLWAEDPFKLDSESHIEIAKSFWDDLTQNDEEIFSQTPPIADERESTPSYFAECSQESDSISPANCDAENCGRVKRRRMLHFSGTGEECVPDSSPAFESGVPNDPQFESCVNSLVSETDEFLMPAPSSPSNIWCPKNDSEETGKGTDDKWQSQCLEHMEPHSPSGQSKIVVRSANHSEASGLSVQSSPTSEGEVLQGPLTPFSKGSTPGWRPSPLTRFRVKATPIAYPFNLVKPNSAHGDVTLSDINQRISSPSPRPSRRLPPMEDQKAPAQSGSGLSGKAVVACTKITTEGNGTITIMRTKG